MSIKLTRRTIIAVIVILACAVLVPIALRAASSSTVLEACVNPGNGNLRLVDAGTSCHNNESRVQWNAEGPAGPPGPPGPPGPSSGGPPFTWICSPARLPNAGGPTRADLYVYNASASTANISVNILDRDGNNLLGHNIPGTVPAATYPGEANGATVPLLSAHTRDLDWQMPVSSGPGFDGITDVSLTVRVISDQSVVVASHFQFNPIGMPDVCHEAPR